MSGPYVLESGADLDRLRWYRAERPDVLIGEGEFGTWAAIIPEENGETMAVRHPCTTCWIGSRRSWGTGEDA